MGNMLFSAAQVAEMSGGPVPISPKNYKLPDRFPSLAKAYRIAIDLESHDPSLGEKRGPGWRRDAYPVGASLAIQDKDGSIPFTEYYPLCHKVGPNVDAGKFYEYLADELAFYSGEIVGANLLYDADGLQYQDVIAPCARWRDVQWAEALLDENAMSYSLNTLAKKWLGQTKVTDELKELYGDYITRFREVHPGHARAYGLGDVTLPLRILDAQYAGSDKYEGLKKQHLVDLFHLESKLMPLLLYMRKQGQKVDLGHASKLGDMLIARRDESLRKASTLSGVHLNAENFGKPTSIKAALDRLGIECPMTAGREAGVDENGKEIKSLAKRPSVKDAWLQMHAGEFGDELATANQCDKAYSTFVNGYVVDYAINGRVHAEFHPLRKVDDESGSKNGTVTGRFSAVHPNLQNIPARDEEIGPLCRAMFIPEDNMDFFSLDYSQIEYRFLVHYAVALKCKGATVPQDMYKKNPDTDFHEMCAALVWAKEWNEALKAGDKNKLKQIRKPAKSLNFGLVYGMGVDKLAVTLGLIGPDGKPSQEAIDLINKYHAGAPFIKDLASKCSKEASEKEYITTILNRRRRFELWEPKFTEKGAPREMALPKAIAEAKWGKGKIKISMTHKAGNARLQGSAADMIKKAMVDIWESGVLDYGNDLILSLTVHDELDGSVAPTERGKTAFAEMRRIMENAIPLNVPVLVSGEIGANWAETH